MTDRTVVVGSGASGVHFALSLLQKGKRVTMLDVGHRGKPPVAPTATISQLKEELPDPSAYFLGSRFEGVFLPDHEGEFYGIPPSKDYVLDPVGTFRPSASGFEPLFSFARGGFAEAWTAGCYPLNDGELSDFPFSFRDFLPYYGEVARRIGVTGEEDDLAGFMPTHEHLLPPLRLDRHSDFLLSKYHRKRDRLNSSGVFIGRTRVATLSQPLGQRPACEYLGRCLWGCPHGALYTPSATLKECQTFPEFEYVPDVWVKRFRLGRGDRVQSVVVSPLVGGNDAEVDVDRLVLAAGTLPSSQIFLASVLAHTGEKPRLRGLMDNRQILVPFLNLGMIGKPFAPDSYQYHLLGMGVRAGEGCDYVHGQITTLKSALLHPIIQRLPFDLGASTEVMRSLHGALGLVNVNFRDTRRDENYVCLSESGADTGQLHVQYQPSAEESGRIRRTMRRVRKALRLLGCIVPPGMAHMRPMGASVHYAGTIPMSRTSAPFTTTEHCQSREFGNLFIVDGSTFPFLPAKNITFSLMANAVRVATEAF